MDRIRKSKTTTLGLVCLAAALIGGAAAAQVALPAPPIPVGSQFGSFQAPPYALDNVQGEWVNLETQLIKPVLVTSDEQHVVVANPADDRVVVYDIGLNTVVAEIVVGQGVTALAERPGAAPVPVGLEEGDVEPPPADTIPGEIWVSIRHQSAVAVINPRMWRITHLLRPPISHTQIGARRADTPGGIAFNTDGTKAYVAASSTDKLVVYNAANKTWIKNIALTRTHNTQSTALNDPMAVIHVNGRIYVTSHLSGNQTIVDSLLGGLIPGAFGPVTGGGALKISVVDLNNDPNRSLPDFDVMVVDTATDTVVDHKAAVGTVLFGLTYHPQSGRLVVSSFETRNGAFIGEGSWANGQVVRNRITGFLPTDPPANYIQVVTENLGPNNDNVVMPTDMAVDATGRLFVAGYASGNVGVWASSGAYLGALRAGAGPRGLAVAAGTKRLYVLNRADATLAYYDISGGIPTPAVKTVALPDPTYDRVKDGRKVFLDPTHSGAGTTGCFSCHQDLRKDGEGWHLSKFFDMATGFTNQSPPQNWRDLKGVMVTQDMRSLADAAPFHWRGEQKDLEDFNGAFVGLLHGSKLGDDEFAVMKDYVFSAVYPPNPFQRMNRVYSASALNGHVVYTLVNSDGTTCNNCHKLPTGTDSGITEGLIGSPMTPFAMKTAQLRGTWTKQSDLANVDNVNPPTVNTIWPATGFGFEHEGSLDSVQEFNDFFFGLLTQPQKDDVTDFVEELDTGLSPCTLYSELLNAATASSTFIGTYMINQANNANCDLAARGRLRLAGTWQNVGLLWVPSAGSFAADDSTIGPFTWATLQTMATNGDADLLFLGLPVWSGERVGVDRDRDGVFDVDEIAQGLDPKNPDTDRDGLWDSYDPQPLLNPNTILPVGAPQVVAGSVQVVFNTTNVVKIVYETDTFSPTRVEFGPTTTYGFFSGDPFPLAGSSNLWKRHHTVFLRPQLAQGLRELTDGIQYEFRIHTQGQNGVTGTSGNFNTGGPIELDVNQPNVRVQSIVVTKQRVGSTVTYTATVTVVDDQGNLAPGVTLRLRFTTFVGTGLLAQNFSDLTSNGSGVIVFSDSNTSQSPGDATVFDIPMLDPNGGQSFHWPEGAISVDETAP